MASQLPIIREKLNRTKSLTVRGEFKPAIFRHHQRLQTAAGNSDISNWVLLRVNVEIFTGEKWHWSTAGTI